MNRSNEQTALDERIARIRKKNEEIIRRKQLIDEEIKHAERNNAIVQVKNSRSENENGTPSLYSDSVSTQQKKTVVYPKIEVSKNRKTDRRRGQEDEAWRREREQIDKERIRRQKAASGWRREWDANKLFDNVEESKPELDKNDPSQKPQGRQLRNNGEDDRGVDRDTSYRSQAKKPFDSNENILDNRRGSSFRSQERRIFENSNEVIESRRQEEEKSSNEVVHADKTETKDTTITINNRRTSVPLNQVDKNGTNNSIPINNWRTSGPLNFKKTITSNETEVPNVKLSKVTKFSETKALKTLGSYSWRNDFSRMDDKESMTSLSQRYENIVISVKKDEKRTVEVCDQAEGNEKPIKAFGLSSKIDDGPAGNSAFQQSKVLPFGEGRKPPGVVFSFRGDSSVSFEQEKVSSPVGILKKSPEISPAANPFCRDDIKPKKSVKISDEFEKDKIKSKKLVMTENEHDENDDDENWEDVSDEEWEDVDD